MAPSRRKSRRRPGPLLSLRARPEPLLRRGSETFSPQLTGPRSCRRLHERPPPGLCAQPADKPPHAHLPQPLVARPLSAPRGCPSAGNLTLAPLPSQPTASSLSGDEPDRGAGSEGGGGGEGDAGSQLRPRPPLRVLPPTQEEEAATAPSCEEWRARTREGRARARTSRDLISRRPARKSGESSPGSQAALARIEDRQEAGLRPELLRPWCRPYAAAGLERPPRGK